MRDRMRVDRVLEVERALWGESMAPTQDRRWLLTIAAARQTVGHPLFIPRWAAVNPSHHHHQTSSPPHPPTTPLPAPETSSSANTWTTHATTSAPLSTPTASHLSSPHRPSNPQHPKNSSPSFVRSPNTSTVISDGDRQEKDGMPKSWNSFDKYDTHSSAISVKQPSQLREAQTTGHHSSTCFTGCAPSHPPSSAGQTPRKQQTRPSSPLPCSPRNKSKKNPNSTRACWRISCCVRIGSGLAGMKCGRIWRMRWRASLMRL